MGKNSVVQQITRAATDVVAAPVRETARAVGADGIVNLADNVKREVDSGVQLVGDYASGDAQEQAAAAKAESAAAETAKEAETVKTIEAETKKKEDATNAEIESKRMAAGSKSRTLLTGAKGLSDETDASGKPITISRRTLKAR